MSDLLVNYYDKYDEDGRLIKKHRQIEFFTTCAYIDKYLKEGMNICEIGAGTGRYSLHYAKKGFKVTSVELVNSNIEVFKQNLKENYDINIHQGNALDLNMLDDNQFDITLVLGPLYHAYTKEDQFKMIEEAKRITKANGLIYIAFIPHDSVILSWGLYEENFETSLKDGELNENFEFTNVPENIFSFVTIDEIKELTKIAKLNKLHIVNTDGLSEILEKQINNMNDYTFKKYVEYQLHISEKEELLGYGNHILYIGRK